MKHILSVLLIAAVVMAANDGNDGSAVSVQSLPSQGTDAITLTLLNTFDPVTKALGLDIFEDTGYTYVLGVNNEGGIIQAYDASTGGALGSLPLDPANGSCFGLAWNNDPVDDTYYTDDWNSSNLFFTDDFGVSWSTVPNPAGSSARGMDYDGDDYWTTNGDGGGLWRFDPGSGQSNLAIPEVNDQPSGVAVFPYEGHVGVAVTTYGVYNIWFYEWDGSTLSYIGNAPCPASCTSSYGLAYSENTGTMFWSHNSGGYKISEFSFDINVSLEQDTWGGIKSAF